MIDGTNTTSRRRARDDKLMFVQDLKFEEATGVLCVRAQSASGFFGLC